MSNGNGLSENLWGQRAMFGYSVSESMLYRISDHMPKRFYHRKKYAGREILSVEEGRQNIISLVERGEPFMVGRYGTSEGRVLMEYHQIRLGLRKDFSEKARKNLCCCSGFFPNEEKYFQQWGELFSDLSSECDIYGVMNFYCEEWGVKYLLPQAILMPNSGIASGRQGYFHCLEGKKVLVIHPMDKTIQKQYKKREQIFPGTNALPLFELQTLRAVNTLADEVDERFQNWFEALDYMTDQVAKLDFDVAVIGCGAYGFPLAARIKQMGKSAIHMGGALQNLFGIKSVRGDQNPSINKDYNEAWVYPDESERPKGAEKVENGCYWAPRQ